MYRLGQFFLAEVPMTSGIALDSEFWICLRDRLRACYETHGRKIGACNTHLDYTLCHKSSKKINFSGR